ncbi:hypothetical protein [Emcibacter nanhaiensis]|uniref:Uncharacterized protein n=1 Tax=Emcibacter nanhaiensis TaxID=1505037 RepID=A0A501PNL7_9PROT|nr:hypothetical protein [Emcibacter nanhaiensis]TPD61707.1 hypothetical protein FIV46_05710 [Emcibacter nanhaiensis]
MTLSMSWIRTVKSTRELIVISDSRLSGGQSWDGNPKIFQLPRSDAVISFAGITNDAYPFIQQAIDGIRLYPPAVSRAMDITDLKGHLVRLFNHSRSFISNLPHGQISPSPPEAVFVLSGYSWKMKEFRIWKLHFDSNIDKFTFRPTTPWQGQNDNSKKVIAFNGDEDAVAEAKDMLVEMLKSKDKIDKGSFNMEPFCILRDIIRSNRFPSVGGPIQMVKIYEHANVAPVGIFWPTKEDGNICIFGRPIMDYEKMPWGIIDPDNPTHIEPLK